MSATVILRMALPSPLRQFFDYLPPKDSDPDNLSPGMRFEVPFGTRKLIGILVEIADRPRREDLRLRRAIACLDDEPLLRAADLRLLRWTSHYYQHSQGETLATALPATLRRGGAVTRPMRWFVTDQGAEASTATLARAPRQAALLQKLQQADNGLDAETLAADGGDWRRALKALQERAWVEQRPYEPAVNAPQPAPGHALHEHQQAAVDAINKADGYAAFLLDGVTGSGKTEVYLHAIEPVIAAGRQALVLVPEISLTPQTVTRFEQHLGLRAAVLHSGQTDSRRQADWLAARSGEASLVIGTRSAVFTPMPALGLIVVDEEHDTSFKQQDGLRYSARDVATVRARQADIPIVLGSATPSLESLNNTTAGRYRLLDLPQRAGGASAPAVEILDIRSRPLEDGLSQALLGQIASELDAGHQVLVFLNRRGYAPVQMCHDCGWLAECSRCDARMTLHARDQRLRCHHCGHERPVESVCPACGSTAVHAVGVGTQRLEATLRRHFPDTGIARIDRDSTRSRSAMGEYVDKARKGELQILIGTQMLAKGHDFPGITLVAIIDTDQGLFGTDFRAGERMAQLITQVAGRAGRAKHKGRVLIQTHHPDHPLLVTLLRHGYRGFTRAALAERQAAALPPFSNQVLLRAEAPAESAPFRFLEQAREQLTPLLSEDIEAWGPVAAPMPRRAGRYRAQLLLQAPERRSLHTVLARWLPVIENLKSARRVRWSVDVDPIELF